eukprot:CAMPEP_0185771258 /NCGR_PEP_ID=MMETSP1174-20130828/63907_1 /TAXON_ID=35687 /ORGANISM="Dictyocha speculum, Strain CCMP1381" /LENGTH=141 /DNA_ID=CAMNT_0028457061 /DNA_START=837 /DNA_END=1262 /DNA_ORIENTATION=-
MLGLRYHDPGILQETVQRTAFDFHGVGLSVGMLAEICPEELATSQRPAGARSVTHCNTGYQTYGYDDIQVGTRRIERFRNYVDWYAVMPLKFEAALKQNDGLPSRKISSVVKIYMDNTAVQIVPDVHDGKHTCNRGHGWRL